MNRLKHVQTMGARAVLLKSAVVQVAALCLFVVLSAVLDAWVSSFWCRLIGLASAAWVAVALSRHWRLPAWWHWINAGFLPVVLLARQWPIDPLVYLLGLVTCLLLFGATFQSRVPLWLSGAGVHAALLAALPRDRDFSFIDLGAGLGGVVAKVSMAAPRSCVVGIEWAPLPFLLGWLRLHWSGYRGQWRCRNLWTVDLADFDVAFAYLSPVPMAALWAKAQREMRPGSLLISYRFAICEQRPFDQIRVGSGEADFLWLWQIGSAAPEIQHDHATLCGPLP